MLKMILIFSLFFVMSGCGKEIDSDPLVTSNTVSDYDIYQQMYDDMPSFTSVTKGIQRSYDMHYSDGSIQTFDMDGVWKEDVTDHLIEYSQNINANGMQSSIVGTYMDGTAYNTYNGVSYFEEMSSVDLKESILVPVDYVFVEESDISSISMKDAEGVKTFTFILNEDGSRKLFDSRYDVYGLSQYNTYEVLSGQIRQSFDVNGYCTSESSDFTARVTVNDVTVDVETKTQNHASRWNESEIVIGEKAKNDFKEYVNYTEIDTNAISDADLTADQPGKDAVETFQKRLLTRLGYTKISNGVYESKFNEHESYTVDFNNKQFIWENYTSSYVYNWKGDTGGFGSSCSYNFGTAKATDDCDDTVIAQIKNVKNDLIMELYYCGLSLEDLISVQ